MAGFTLLRLLTYPFVDFFPPFTWLRFCTKIQVIIFVYVVHTSHSKGGNNILFCGSNPLRQMSIGLHFSLERKMLSSFFPQQCIGDVVTGTFPFALHERNMAALNRKLLLLQNLRVLLFCCQYLRRKAIQQRTEKGLYDVSVKDLLLFDNEYF